MLGNRTIDRVAKGVIYTTCTLNLDEQGHVGEIAESLNFTITQMAKIDAEYLKAFPAH